MEKIGFGLIGCGFIGMLHGEIIASLENGYLAAVADSSSDRRKEAAARWGCTGYETYQEMLKDPAVQAIAVCLPSGLHSQAARDAAQAGRHVICEKPIDISVERAAEMVQVCRNCGVELSVIMQHRFDRPVMLLKKTVDEGRLGKLLWGASRTIWYRDDRYFSNPWRGTWKYDGGGALINQSIHYIDLLLYIFGKPESVSGKCRKLLHEQIETEDVGIGTVEFENGCLGTIEGTTAAYPGLYAELAVFAEKGTVIIRNDELLFYQFQDGKDPAFEELLNPQKANSLHQDAGVDPASHRRQYEDFVTAVREKRKPVVTGEDALMSLKLIKGIYESSQQGKEVRL